MYAGHTKQEGSPEEKEEEQGGAGAQAGSIPPQQTSPFILSMALVGWDSPVRQLGSAADHGRPVILS